MTELRKFPKRIKTVIEEEGEFRVIEVEIPDKEASPLPKQDELKIIGHEYTRKEAVEKVTGQAKFTGDVRLQDMLYGKILRSQKPKAAIKNIDTSEAERSPGVRAVITLNKEKTFYVGEKLAAVAAETLQQAEDALSKIKVEYVDEAYVVNIDRAIRENAPKAIDRDNKGRPRENTRGNLESGFSNADTVIENEYITQTEVHNPLEPHCSVVKWEGNNLLVYTSTQTIDISQSGITQQIRREFPDLKVSDNQVRVILYHLGGGFGCKIGPTTFEIMAAKLARTTNRPVRLEASREDVCLDTGNRGASIQKIKLGAKQDGTLTAIELNGFAGGGVGSGENLRPAVEDMYACPNMKFSYQTVNTNIGGQKATRAPGHVQAFFAMETAMDELANELGMDPLEFRKRNYSETSAGNTGRPYTSKALDQCYDKGAAAIDWNRRNQTPGSPNSKIKRGVGVGSLMWGGVGNPGSIVEIDFFRDGSINARCGTQDIGTGTRTIMAQVAAEELGLTVDDINVQVGDTDYPPGSPSYGSLTAASVCPCIRNAIQNVIEKLYPAAALKLNTEPDNLEFDTGFIKVKNSNIRVNFKDLLAEMTERKITGSGGRSSNPNEYSGNTFGAHFAEVEVDTETGRVKVIKVAAAHDSGRIINPLTARNQVHGGVCQAVSYALMERKIMDNRTGRMTNPNFRDYKSIPVTEMPEIEVIFADNIDPHLNNLGMKGLGEPPRIGTAAAIGNAIFNAIGVRLREIPFTPEDIINGLAARKERG